MNLARLKPFRPIALPLVAVLAAIPAFVAGCNPDNPPVTCGDGFEGGGDCCSGFDGCCDFGGCPPTDQPVTISPVRPQPLMGGTLLISKSGTTALVADADRNRVVLVDLKSTAVQSLSVPAGTIPGRAVEDASGIFHVVLRGGAAILNVDPSDLSTTTQTPVCEQPRGIALDEAQSRILVACASGELRVLSAAKTPEALASTILPEGDLRDVAVSNGKVYVSHFRSTNVDVLDATLAPSKTRQPKGYTGAFTDVDGSTPQYAPTVAWRMVAKPQGGVLLVHQEARSSSVVIPDEGGSTYGGFDCNSAILHSSVTNIGDDGEVVNAEGAGGLANIPLPADIAIAHDGERIAVLGAANSQVLETTVGTISQHDGCADNFPGGGGSVDANGNVPDGRVLSSSQEPIALAYDGDDNLIVQIREPAMLEIHGSLSGMIMAQIPLGGESRFDTGYTMFHSNPDNPTFTPVACASCHPEGREDGHTWNFFNQGARRTQSLAGNIAETAPFHWTGDLADIGAVMDEVFVKRMGGFPQSEERVDAVSSYIDTFPAAPRVAQPLADAVARGQALFESADVGCADCHNGAKLTNNTTVDVGTDGTFQVPSLSGIASRAPFMHDGCAATLRDRFDPSCGGGEAHGHTAQLSEPQLADLIAYLDTL